MMFLEDYVDTMESLPAELARNFTLIKELDALAADAVARVRSDTDCFLEKVAAMDKPERTEWLQRLAATFKDALRHGEEKVALASQTYEMVDRHIRRMDEDLARYDEEMMVQPRGPAAAQRPVHEKAYRDTYRDQQQQYEDPGRKRKDMNEIIPTPNKKIRMADRNLNRASPEIGSGKVSAAGRKIHKDDVKRKVKKTASAKAASDLVELSPYRSEVQEIPIDPNEPTYCLCGRVSFGEMIACDDEECEIEWFHYECVGLTAPLRTKAKWYCPQCTAKRQKGRK
ncbi:inhibitor of growth proteins N-terminal histone-binding-domain-containing protein [Hyaloraphidium curvatum]|nr:inhibitor of growth proteins N-terminal histone-binding-domain-containing protein [Hyaloraphidium curvatum]